MSREGSPRTAQTASRDSPEGLRAANAAADGEKSRARSRLLPYAAFTLSLRALAAAAFPDLAEAAAAAESEKGGSGAASRKLIAHVGKMFRKRKAKAEGKKTTPAAAQHGAAGEITAKDRAILL